MSTTQLPTTPAAPELVPAPKRTVKDHARRLVERLPEDGTWEELLYSIEVVRGIERGIARHGGGERRVPRRGHAALGSPPMSVAWSQGALDEFRAVLDYLARVRPTSAAGLAGRIDTRVDLLDGQPLLGAEVPEYADPLLREVYEAPYRVLYRVAGADVVVVSVVHAAQQLPRTPPG